MKDVSRDLSPAQPLNGPLRSLLERPELRESLAALLSFEIAEPKSALPRKLDQRTAQSWLAGHRVVITLARPPAVGRDRFWVVLPVAHGSLMADRILGGEGREGVASAAGQLSQAECGVLAYAAARCCAAVDSGLSVMDVECPSPESLAERASGGVLWPLSLLADGRSIALSVVFPEGAAVPQTQHQLSVTLEDSGPPNPPQLAEGDVLVSEDFLVTATARGIEGSVRARVDGCIEGCSGRVSDGELRLTDRPLPQLGPYALQLSLHRLSVSFEALCALTSGEPLPVRIDGAATVSVERASATLAEGELVWTPHGVGVSRRPTSQ